MRRYFQHDADGTVMAIATNPSNLHRNNDWLMDFTDGDIFSGDHYDQAARSITPRPDRRIKPAVTEEDKIQIEIRKMAIERLKQRGDLPQNYE